MFRIILFETICFEQLINEIYAKKTLFDRNDDLIGI